MREERLTKMSEVWDCDLEYGILVCLELLEKESKN
jgi:hypothetical protein